jgi:hypothetical protein
VTVPDLPRNFADIEAYHAAVVAALEQQPRLATVYGDHKAKDRRVADRALARLWRHAQCNTRINGKWTNDCRASAHLSCPDALDAWADLTDIGTTCGVTQ